MRSSHWLFSILFLTLIASSSFAADFVPSGNINGRNVYQIYQIPLANFTTANATRYCIGSDCRTNFNTFGNSSANGSQWAASGVNIYNINSGNVGINTTTPTNLFNVYGDVNFTGTLYANLNNTYLTIADITAPWILGTAGKIDFNGTKLNNEFVRKDNTSIVTWPTTVANATLAGYNWTNVSAINISTANLWQNASDQATIIGVLNSSTSNLWGNASSQAIRIDAINSSPFIDNGAGIYIKNKNISIFADNTTNGDTVFINGTLKVNNTLTVNSTNIWGTLFAMNGFVVNNRTDTNTNINNNVSSVRSELLANISLKLNLTGGNMTGDLNTTGNLTSRFITADMDWTHLQNYPVACTSDSSVTTIGDSNICTLVASMEHDPLWSGNFTSLNAFINLKANASDTQTKANSSSSAETQVKTNVTWPQMNITWVTVGTNMYNSLLGNVTLGSNITGIGLRLNITGNVGATNYCDTQGANCFVLGDLQSKSNTTTYATANFQTIDVAQTKANSSSVLNSYLRNDTNSTTNGNITMTNTRNRICLSSDCSMFVEGLSSSHINISYSGGNVFINTTHNLIQRGNVLICMSNTSGTSNLTLSNNGATTC